MKAETAVGKLEEIGEIGKGSIGEVGKSSIRTVKKIRIVDESIIPRIYLVPNIQKITEDIMADLEKDVVKDDQEGKAEKGKEKPTAIKAADDDKPKKGDEDYDPLRVNDETSQRR